MADSRIRADDLGAWLIKCQPRVNPELPRSIWAGDPQPITRWCVADNYRSRMMGPGDRAVLWVSGDGRQLARGIWGLGWVTGPVRPMVDELGVETDKLEVPLHLPLLPSGLTAEEIKAAGVTDLEVLRLPQGSNPSWVSLDQLRLLAELVEGHGGILSACSPSRCGSGPSPAAPSGVRPSYPPTCRSCWTPGSR